MSFAEWIDTFVDEKGYDREEFFDVPGAVWGSNLIPLGVVVEAMKTTSPQEQEAIKANIIALDFVNPAAPKRYLAHLANALAI